MIEATGTADRETLAPSFRSAIGGLLVGLLVLSLIGWGLAEIGRYLLPLLGLTNLDAGVTVALREGRTVWLTRLMLTVSMLGDLWLVTLLVVVLGVAGWKRERHWRILWIPALAGAGALVISIVVKMTTGRARPPEPYAIVDSVGAAFPSGHALRVFAVYGAIAWLVAATVRGPVRRATVWGLAGLVITGVGFSRVYLAAHWLTDVVAGFALGAAWLALVMVVAYARPIETGIVRLAAPPDGEAAR